MKASEIVNSLSFEFNPVREVFGWKSEKFSEGALWIVLAWEIEFNVESRLVFQKPGLEEFRLEDGFPSGPPFCKSFFFFFNCLK